MRGDSSFLPSSAEFREDNLKTVPLRPSEAVVGGVQEADTRTLSTTLGRVANRQDQSSALGRTPAATTTASRSPTFLPSKKFPVAEI
jgi:hypothetical protein